MNILPISPFIYRGWSRREQKMLPVAHFEQDYDSARADGVDVYSIRTYAASLVNGEPVLYDTNTGTTPVFRGTGLSDSHGKHIFEGDIVKLKFRDGIDKYSFELGVIRWHGESAAFKWFAVEEDPSDANNYWLTHADATWREVVGNEFESPELLEATS